MEQSQWQRPAAPSFHRKPPILPPLSSSGPVLFPLWGRGWGSNDGRYPLARNGKSHLNIHPLLVFCPIRPSSEFILSTILLPACSSPLVYLILSCSETRSIGTHTNKHTVYSPPVPRASCLSLIRVSSEWGGWVSPLHLSTNKPRCLTWQRCCWASHPSFPACPENRENNKVSLDPEWKSAQLVSHRECPQAEGVGCERVVENYRGKLC